MATKIFPFSKVTTPTTTTTPAINIEKLFFKDLHREFMPDLLKNHGDFLLRRGQDGGRVLSVNAKNKIQHYKFDDKERVYVMERQQFPSLEALLAHFYHTGQSMSSRMEVILRNPVYNTFELIESSRINFVAPLGKGNFGEVWKATLMPEEATVAIKIIGGNASEKDRAECMAEAKLMSLLDHENVVRLRGLSFWTQDPTAAPRLLIVIEFCNYGSLDKLLERNMVEDRGKVRALVDTAKGLEYLHQRDIIHRDIASRNCLVHRDGRKITVKVADFGLSRLAPEHYELVTKRRLPVFSTPPETLRLREWTSSSDVWSFGILIHEVYNQSRNPYEAALIDLKLKVVVDKLEGGFRLPMPPGMPREMGDLVAQCLHKDPQQRPKMSAIVATLKDFHVGANLP